MDFWNHGEQTKIAKVVGIPRQKLNDVLHRRRSVKKETAVKLYYAAQLVLKQKIPWESWLFNSETKHPAFFGAPIEPTI